MSQHVISPLLVSLIVVTSVAEAFGQTSAIAFPTDRASVAELQGTYRLPGADGTARVERIASTTRIRLQVDDLIPATLFGGDYNTYVVWSVAETGETKSLGELLLDGDHAEIEVSTDVETFGLLITAEPHFMVRAPSRFVVMEFANAKSKVQYKASTDIYNFKRDSLAGLKEARGDVESGVQQAVTALRLARRARAEEFAPDEFAKAKLAVNSLLGISNDGTARSETVDAKAREAVRFAVRAENVAHDRALAGIPDSIF